VSETVVNVTVESEPDINVTIESPAEISVNFYETAQLDPEIATYKTDAESARDAALVAKNAAESAQAASAISETNAAASATAAASSASAASTSATSASGSATAASTSATNAATSATNAATSETNALSYKNAANTSATNAATSETNAANSATAAQNAMNSAMWRDVVFLTFADSPYTITSSQKGKLFSVDSSSGAVTINLPQISTLDLSTVFALAVKKTDSSGNSVTVNRAGTDNIDSSTSFVISTSSAGAVFIPDTDPSPDAWTTAQFGASAGNLTSDVFSGTGSQTAFTLSVSPGSKNNTWVFVEGIYQQKASYSLSGATLTFSEAPPSGASNVEVLSGTTLSVGTPSDGTVTLAKLNASIQIPQSYLVKPTHSRVCVVGGSGQGSTNTAIRRFTTVKENTGTAITLAQSSTLGDTFTINENGHYSIHYKETSTTDGGAGFGISINSNQLTTTIGSITDANFVSATNVPTTSRPATLSTTIKCVVGDVIRAHGEGSNSNGTTKTQVSFEITKVQSL
jgi:hypothetical protein